MEICNLWNPSWMSRTPILAFVGVSSENSEHRKLRQKSRNLSRNKGMTTTMNVNVKMQEGRIFLEYKDGFFPAGTKPAEDLVVRENPQTNPQTNTSPISTEAREVFGLVTNRARHRDCIDANNRDLDEICSKILKVYDFPRSRPSWKFPVKVWGTWRWANKKWTPRGPNPVIYNICTTFNPVGVEGSKEKVLLDSLEGLHSHLLATMRGVEEQIRNSEESIRGYRVDVSDLVSAIRSVGKAIEECP